MLPLFGPANGVKNLMQRAELSGERCRVVIMAQRMYKLVALNEPRVVLVHHAEQFASRIRVCSFGVAHNG